MALDGRLPVIVGGGQVCQRSDEGDGVEPVDLLAEAFRKAADDAEPAGAGGGLVESADSIRVVQILSWRYRDAGAAVAERLGSSPRHTLYTGPGGQWPQALVSRAALDIQAGRADVVLVGGAETWRSRIRARAAGRHRSWPRQPDTVAPTELLGEDTAFAHPAELARAVLLPVQQYPLLESALRTAAGRSPADHEAFLAGLWSRFSEVAAANPDAWARQAYTPAELLEVAPDNRMIGWPYRKRWCSNNSVDMAAGLVLCSAERATALGIGRDRWVFPWAGSDAEDGFVSVRADLHGSPAIRSAGETAFRLAGAHLDDVTHVDLYSCFPSAVELAAAELGLDVGRSLTVTGGLPFAGGPWNNYVTHALATMAGVLRAAPGQLGLVTGLGGFATKHAVGLYSTDPPPAGEFRWEGGDSPRPARDVAEDHEGPATLEACTAMYDRDGTAETGIATCLTADGRRAWTTTHDPGTMAAMVTEELAGRDVTVTAGGVLELP